MISNIFWAVDFAHISSLEKLLAATPVAMAVPPVQQINALENYSENELNWMGIDTEHGDKGGMVAVISVSGILSTDWYCGTNTEWLVEQLEICEESPLIIAIVLKFKSPGGTVDGTLFYANAIKKCKKPVVAWAQSVVGSAAYVGYSQAKECWMESGATTMVGSIGSITKMRSQNEANKMEGLDVRVIRSPADKALGDIDEPINEAAVAEMQRLTDAMTVELLAQIRSVRPQIPADISAKVFFGKEAIKAGLADKVGSLADAIKRADYLGRMAMV